MLTHFEEKFFADEHEPVAGQDGPVRPAFELRARQGEVLTWVDNVKLVALNGPVRTPSDGVLPTSKYGSGYIWFFDTTGGCIVQHLSSLSYRSHPLPIAARPTTN